MNALLFPWLPILLSAVVVFVISSLIHMVMKWHALNCRAFANENAVLDAALYAVGSGLVFLWVRPRVGAQRLPRVAAVHVPWEFFGSGKGANTSAEARVYADMNAKHKKGKLCAITLGLITALLAGCVSTGAGTTTIDPPAPPGGLPNPPPVTLPTPGTR